MSGYQKPNVKINLTGGLVSPSELLNILAIAQKTGMENIGFGARQQILLSVHPREKELFDKKMHQNAIGFDVDLEKNPNLTSSFAFSQIFQTAESWVTEGVYLDVFSLFDFKPALKINICDGQQSHAPFFTGHLNFISSDVPNFWFCYLRFPKSNQIEQFPKLIYTQDLAAFSREIEEKWHEKTTKNTPFDLNALAQDESAFLNIIFRQIDADLTLPRFVMPYYEGVNAQPDGRLWLGIYRRNDDFSVKFLTELCQLCEETRIGTICVTAWRSLIVKGIDRADRFKWEKLLGKHGINVRHANNELNWQVEDDSKKGFKLKQYLVKRFDAMDVRTFGLVFAVKTRHKSEVFGSIIIRREPFFKIGKLEFDPLSAFGSYDIFYAEDFNPHTRRRKTFATGVPKARLAEELLNLTKKYYAELTGEKMRTRLKTVKKSKEDEATQWVQRCSCCWTVIPNAEEEECSVCGAPQAAFEKIDAATL